MVDLSLDQRLGLDMLIEKLFIKEKIEKVMEVDEFFQKGCKEGIILLQIDIFGKGYIFRLG